LEAELFLANGRTDMAKLIVAFPYFANAPERGYKFLVREMLGVYHGHEALCSNGLTLL
jgi:hypothetical protein